MNIEHDKSEAYVERVTDTRACAACAGCSSGAQEYLFNANLARRCGYMTNLTVVPQIGYLGPQYFDQQVRILVLGKNPGGGDEGAIYYNLQQSIEDVTSVNEAMSLIHPEIMRRWKPLRDMRLFEHIRLEQIAYANQILCRTDGAIREMEYGEPSAFNEVYKMCFQTRLLPFIRLLRPHHIIAMGKKVDAPWPEKLARLLYGEPDCRTIRVHGVTFPFGSNISTAQSDLRNAFLEINGGANAI